MKAQLSLFLAVVVLFVSAFGQSGDPPQVYCGRSLANMMAALCYAKYDTKRSDYNSVHLGYEPEFTWPWLGTNRVPQRHMQDRALAVRDMSRGKRGIIEDCCEQSCSIQTLMTYC